MIRILVGDCRERMRELEADSVDSCVCDPPYLLEFMGKAFDKQHREMVGANDGQRMQAWHQTWADEVFRVMKPGAHLVAFSGTRTYHRMVCAIEDAGFEIRDQLAWVYGSGFPKSHDVSKGIDKAAGARGHDSTRFNAVGQQGARTTGGDVFRSDHPDYIKPRAITPEAKQWQGWGTALKPSWEPICLARKPLQGTVAANVLKWGTGAINIDGCRVGTDGGTKAVNPALKPDGRRERWDERSRGARNEIAEIDAGRWPANLCLSYPEDEYALRPGVTAEEKRELFGWLHANA